MKRLPSSEKSEFDPIGEQLWEEIVYSMDQYTHDSSISKFYSPESILKYCKTDAVIFTQLLYTPIPSKASAQKTNLYRIMYLSMSCGVQIYFKERALLSHVPYGILDTNLHLRETRNKIGKMLSEGIKVKPPVSQVMELFLLNLNSQKYIQELTLKGREFNTEKFDNLLPAAVMWGYLFAKELVFDIH